VSPSSIETALDLQHKEAMDLFTGALEACSIQAAFDRHIRFEGNILHRLLSDGAQTIDLSAFKRIYVLSIGKAAGPLLETLLQRMKRRKGVRGICCTNQLPRSRNWRFRYFSGGHPLPNEDSFSAARAALGLLKKARKDTLVFFLVSGGGSAMLELPLDHSISLEDTVAFNEALLASGAPITEVNTLRKHFSAVKGGRLAIAAPDATKISLLLPDVPLNSLDALASGPSTPDHSTVDEVRAILKKFNLAPKLTPAVRAFFERDDLPESPGKKVWQRLARLPWAEARTTSNTRAIPTVNLSEEDPAFRNSVYEVLLSSDDLVEGARALAKKNGYHVVIDNSCDDWDYADAARYLFERFHALRADHPRLCLISAGEVTVTLGSAHGSGGRNQQFVLACIDELARHPSESLTVFSAGSDGIDGNTQAAGAVADPTTLSRARDFGFDPDQALATFDACPLFTAIGDSVVVGPTGHNLRDLRLLIASRT